jgi:hypothetical protein
MTKLLWDQVGERLYETGVSHGVLYLQDGIGAYTSGFAWNGLTTVTESPTGAASNKQYADNTMYLNLLSTELFGGDIEAFTYPDEWAACDGTAEPQPGVSMGQQKRKTFGLSYRTQLGNDVDGTDHGYKIHLVWGALASPSQKAYATINDNPAALAFKWSFTTTPIDPGVIGGVTYKPTASMVIDSSRVDPTALAALEAFLYGTVGTDPSLPTPADVIALFAGTVTVVTPTAPSYNGTTHVITIPTVTGVNYTINGEIVTGTVTITTSTVVKAYPTTGHMFPAVTDDDWLFVYP